MTPPPSFLKHEFPHLKEEWCKYNPTQFYLAFQVLFLKPGTVTGSINGMILITIYKRQYNSN